MEIPNHLSYLTKSTQRIKMGSAFSDWANIVKGIPQGSIPDLLLFNIVSIDLLFFSESFEFCYFADENLSFFSGRNST